MVLFSSWKRSLGISTQRCSEPPGAEWVPSSPIETAPCGVNLLSSLPDLLCFCVFCSFFSAWDTARIWYLMENSRGPWTFLQCLVVCCLFHCLKPWFPKVSCSCFQGGWYFQIYPSCASSRRGTHRICIVHCSRKAQQSDMHLLSWAQGHLCYSPAGPLQEKKCSCFVLTERDQHKLEICMPVSTAKCLAARQSAVLVTLCNSAVSFDLFSKMCLFLFVHQRTVEAFLLLYSSWFKQALLRFSVTAWIVWRDLGDKQQFACRARRSVCSLQPEM